MELSRREFVATGAAATGALLAGCSGDDDGNGTPEPDGNGEDESTEQLGIENVRLVAREPDGYREYEEVEDGIYGADEIVWIYYEPVGLASEDSGNGQERIDLQFHVSIRGPGGQEQASHDEDIERDIISGPDEHWRYWSYQPSTPSDPGEYTAEITIRDEIAGEEVQQTVTFTLEGSGTGESLGIEHVRLVAKEPAGYREYEEVEDGTYGTDETIWIYFEPVGLATEEAGNGQEQFSLTHSLLVTTPDGEELGETRELSETVEAGSGLDERWLFWQYRPPTPTEPGEYVAEITLSDEVGNEETISTVTFTIEDTDEDQQFLSTLESQITADLTVDVTSISETDGTVELAYESQHSIDEDRAEYEIGYVAGSFGSLINEGWDIETLSATLTDSEGDRYRFTVERTLIERWLNGELTDDEFGRAVLETLEEVGGAASA
jgi:hypothetical protein